MRRPSRNRHHGAHDALSAERGRPARFLATSHWSTRSARSRPSIGSRRRCRIAVDALNGTLATTRNGWRGSAIRSASPSITLTPSCAANRRRSCSANAESSSTARTAPARLASSDVRRPVPAPISTTRSSDRTPASSTSCLASARLARRFWPCARRRASRGVRARRARTDDHNERTHVGIGELRGAFVTSRDAIGKAR